MNNFEKDILAIVFPKIIDQLKGTDANIEIIKSSDIQILKLAVKPPIAVEKIAYIFVMTKIEREDLEPLLHDDAELIASEAYKQYE